LPLGLSAQPPPNYRLPEEALWRPGSGSTAVTYAPGGLSLAVGNAREVSVWDSRTGLPEWRHRIEASRQPPRPGEPVKAPPPDGLVGLAFAPDGKQLL